MMENKKISKVGLIFTFNKFWEIGSGANMEIEKQVLNFPSESKNVIFPFYVSKKQREQLKKEYNLDEVLCVMNPKIFLFRAIRSILYRLRIKCPYVFLKPFRYPKFQKRKIFRLLKKRGCDLLLCEYIWYADLLADLIKDESITTVIETHDIQSNFCNFSKKNNHGIIKFDVSEKDEVAIVNKFDIVLAISRTDEQYFQSHLNEKPLVVYLPSVLSSERNESSVLCKENHELLQVGFIGNEAIFNIDAMRWIKDKLLVKKEIVDKTNFNIYGKVCNAVTQSDYPANVHFHGLIENISDAYMQNDIMINPTFQSGGIKTKNIEAFLNGRPVITTTIGSYGMETAEQYGCMFIANTPEEYITIILNINKNRSILENMQERCTYFMEENFNSDLYDQYIEKIQLIMNRRREQNNEA